MSTYRLRFLEERRSMRRDWNNWRNGRRTVPGVEHELYNGLLTEASMAHPKNWMHRTYRYVSEVIE